MVRPTTRRYFHVTRNRTISEMAAVKSAAGQYAHPLHQRPGPVLHLVGEDAGRNHPTRYRPLHRVLPGATSRVNYYQSPPECAALVLSLSGGQNPLPPRPTRCCPGDILFAWKNHRLKIEMSKGFKERLIYLSNEAFGALSSYLNERGSKTDKDWVFLYRQNLLSNRYCQRRLQTYGKHIKVVITPHQLRFTCATLMLNSGIPAITIQTILGHQHIDTTLGYARLYEKSKFYQLT